MFLCAIVSYRMLSLLTVFPCRAADVTVIGKQFRAATTIVTVIQFLLMREKGLHEIFFARMVFLLRVLEVSQHSCGLCLEEVALFVRLDGEHPSSGHIIFRFDLPHVNEIKNFIINTGFALKTFCFSKPFLVSSYFLS